ncbi:hypothetical protein PA905_34040 [Planktothrix agardhii CCAP 1459/11A]|uniref:Calx-beta domain-containing protein n=1 Tax=Planktothrix agardhii CCAP 1459/11A TaxID=282420 RepID=A0A4P5ZYH4_PLAAG|nr:Calx-beta domain-containing protein [Planktothrix agardhii]GDZ95165.1 hypothetical protein PA905_34040 [Planktothrix agardhii CCAP 1459/11A]
MTIEFTLSEYRVKEDGTWSTERPSIIRTGGTGACSVKISNSSSSTTAGRGTRDKDYTAISSTTVSFADGETGIKYIDFQIIQDTLDEPDEYIPLSLSLVSGTETLGAIKSSKVTILDDDEPAPPVPILVKQVENIGLRQVNLGGYGESKVFCVNINTSLPKGRELAFDSDISQHLNEIILPPNTSDFPLRQIGLFTDWGTPANTYFYLFCGEIEDFVCASPSNPDNIVVCPSASLNSRTNNAKNTAIVGNGTRIWVATDTPNTPMRLFISVENYATNWVVENGISHNADSFSLFPVVAK